MADIYSQSVKPGPSLPAANRSALMAPFRSNSSYFRPRLLAALSTVSVHLLRIDVLSDIAVKVAKWGEVYVLCQVRALSSDIVQKDKIFAIGYCFGGGGVLELARAWPNTPGLLGQYKTGSDCFHADSRADRGV